MFLSYLSYWEISQGSESHPLRTRLWPTPWIRCPERRSRTGYSGLTYPVALRSQENAGVCECGGPIFPCERVSETSPAMCIGSLETGFDLENAERLLNFANITSERCKRCWCFRHCTLCAKRRIPERRSSPPTQKLKYCQEAKGIAYREIQNCLLMREIYQFYPGQVRRGRIGR